MKFVDADYTILEQENGISGIYKQIELAGRTCYKSENKIAEGTAEEFTKRMIDSGHTAMLEHGTVYLLANRDFGVWKHLIERYERNEYSIVKGGLSDYSCYVTTNFRVLVENGWLDDLKYVCEPTPLHEKRLTVKFIIDRVTSQSMCRHRVFSFAQESTRFCNYSKDKFNNEIQVVIPRWMYDLRDRLSTYENSLDGTSNEWMKDCTGDGMVHMLSCHDRSVAAYVDNVIRSEQDYIFLTTSEESIKLKAEDARGILPLDVKTEIVMTGTIAQWYELFKLRIEPHAHPNIRYIMTKLKEELDETYK